MGLLDRFKNKKEAELKGASAPVVSSQKQSKTSETKAPEKKIAKVVRQETTRVILSPVVSEKAAYLSAKNVYAFAVSPKATRVQIAAAFKELYGVQPKQVNVVVNRGEYVRFGRNFGRTKSWKKAYVTVPAGKQVQIYEAV